MRNPFATLSAAEREELPRRAQPKWTAPMLATLTGQRFSASGWIYERKVDGVRCLAFRKNKTVRLLSRTDKSQNEFYPELAEAMREQAARDFIVDGEIVAFEKGVTSFARLQQRMHTHHPAEALRRRVAVYYYAFDLLHLHGRDTTGLPLRRRKVLLREALTFHDPVRYMLHRNTDGERYFDEACRKGWEGLIAKRADSAYVHSRSTDWLKFKCANSQELVIGGYTDPKGKRTGFGALLVGYYEHGRLRYAGRVGTGYDDATLERLGGRLSKLERRSSPFADEDIPKKGVHWIAPKLVAEAAFTEWTERGRLRHPRFLGLRTDKAPKNVVRERPKS
jgi:bifunctional non-homologous end joining protein LigD